MSSTTGDRRRSRRLLPTTTSSSANENNGMEDTLTPTRSPRPTVTYASNRKRKDKAPVNPDNVWDFEDEELQVPTPKKRQATKPKNTRAAKKTASASLDQPQESEMMDLVEVNAVEEGDSAKDDAMDLEENGDRIDNGAKKATPKTNSPRKHEDHVVILESRLRPRKAPVQEQADSEEESSASGDDGTGDDTGNESESEDEDTVYAEKIMNERTREGKKFYLIKWEGYTHDADEWIPEEEVDPALVAAYEASSPGKKRKPAMKRDETYVDGGALEEMAAATPRKRRGKIGGSEQAKRPRKKRAIGENGEVAAEDATPMDEATDASESREVTPKRAKKSTGSKKKVAAPKKPRVIKAQKLAEQQRLKEERVAERAERTAPSYPGFEFNTSKPTEPDASCCMICASREFSRAIVSGDWDLLQKCGEMRTDISDPVQWGTSADLPHETAMYHAIVRNDLRAVKYLLQEENDSWKRVNPPEEFYKSATGGTGYVGRRTFNHRVKAVNEARGNREGNNAFYNKSSTDPLNSLPASGASSSFAGASKKRSGSNSHTSPKDIMLYRILADTSVTPETMDYLMMESKKFKDPITMYGVYEAAAAGNKAMVEHVVEVLQNGYGFNHLHAEVLKLSEGASLTSYRKNQILKKATGNYSITPLELAAINPNPTFLKELCEALTPAETTEQDERGRTALHFAAACSDPAPLEYLLSKGMDPMREDFNRLTPLLLASKYGRENNIPVLVNAMGGGSDAADHTLLKDGYRALHFAAHYGHAETIKALISASATIDILDKKTKATPLHHASKMGHFESVKALVEAGADPSSTDKMGRTPLHLASKNGHYDIVKYLLEQGVDANAVDTSENAVVHYAAAYGWPSIVTLLVEFGGADVNAANNWKYTPLMVADMKGHMKVVSLLLSIPSVQVNFRDKEGSTMLHRCIVPKVTTQYEAKRLMDKMTAVVNRGGDPNIQNLQGETPLHLLAACTQMIGNKPADGDENGFWNKDLKELRLRQAEWLLSHDVNIKTKDERTSLSIAIQNDNTPMIVFLLQNKANIRCKLAQGRNILHYLAMLAARADTPVYEYYQREEDWGEARRAKNRARYQQGMKRVWDVLVERYAEEILTLMSEPDDEGYTPFLRGLVESHKAQMEERRKYLNWVDELYNSRWRYNLYDAPSARTLLKFDYRFDTLIEFIDAVKSAVEVDLDSTVRIPKDHQAGTVPPAETGFSMIHFAAKYHHATLLKHLCDLGAHVNNNGPTGNVTPLYLALEANTRDRDPEATEWNQQYFTFEYTPIVERWKETVDVLLEHGADATCVCGADDDTALLRVARSSLEIFQSTPVVNEAGETAEFPSTTPNDTDATPNPLLSRLITQAGKDGLDRSQQDGETALMHFIRRKDCGATKQLIEAGANVNASTRAGDTVGILAVNTGDIDIVKAVVRNGKANLSQRDRNGDTALIHAARLGDPAVAVYLLENGVDVAVNVANEKKETALHVACRKGAVDVVRTLLRKGADVNVVNESGSCPLIEALKAKGRECVAALLGGETPADVDVKDGGGAWALHYAVKNNDWRTVKLLLDAGADASVADTDGHTPLHLAIQNSKSAINTSLRIERLLIGRGAPINAKDVQGRTPLHIAFVDVCLIPSMHIATQERKRHEAYQKSEDKRKAAEERVKAIVEKYSRKEDVADQWIAAPELDIERKKREKKGNDLMEIDERSAGVEWYTGLWEPKRVSNVKSDPIEIVSWLVEVEGIEIDVPDRFGRTPLHYAGRCGAFTCSSYLLDRRALIDREDADKNTPLQISLLYEHIDYAVMLANRGAEVLRNMTTSDGQTLSTFKCALSRGFMSLAYLIMEKGQELMSAVHDALCTGKYHLAVLLISKSPRELLQFRHPTTGQTLLHIFVDFTPPTMSAWEEYAIEIAEILLDAGLDPAAVDVTGRTALHYASKFGHVDVVKMLLLRVPVECATNPDVDGRSALSYALACRHVSIVKVLLEVIHTVPEESTLKSPSVMYHAVALGNLEIVQALIDRHATVDADGFNNGFATALLLALNADDPKILKALVEARVDVRTPSPNKVDDQVLPLYPIFAALRCPNPTVFNETTNTLWPFMMIVKAGADLNVRESKTGRSPLHLAIERKDWIKAKCLVENGADVNALDPLCNRAPIQIAVVGNNVDLLNLLLTHGSPNVNIVDETTGQTLVDAAITRDDLSLLQKLLDIGIDLSVRSTTGRTALMECALQNKTDAFTKIIDHPKTLMDINALDANGGTILHYIVQPRSIASYENVELLRLAVAKGIDMEIADHYGNCAIDYAYDQKGKKMYNALLSLGARDVDPAKKISRPPMDVDPLSTPNIDDDAALGREELLRESEHLHREERQKIAAKRGITIEQLDEEEKLEAIEKRLDPNLGLGKDVASLVMDGDEPYDVLMTKTDVDKGHYGMNMFYRMQVVYNRVQDVFILFTRWGAVGETGMFQRTPFSTRDSCIAEFLKIFRSKTGNPWATRLTEFQSKPGKYTPVKASTRKEVQLKPLDLKSSPPSTIPSSLQDLIKIIADVQTMKSAVTAQNLGLPLGNIDREVLLEAYETLCSIRDKVKELESLRTASAVPDVKALKTLRYDLVSLTNKYFSLLPVLHESRNGIRAIQTLDDVNTQMIKMAGLMYLDSGSNVLIAAHARRKETNPLDYITSALRCRFDEVGREGEEFRIVKEYMEDTGDGRDYEIVSLYGVEREEERGRFEDLEGILNRKLLWHGSRLSNFIGILSQGLRIAPIEAPATGYMFGKGIYFADMFAKSIGYADNSDHDVKTAGYGCLLLCDVELGQSYQSENAEYMEKPREGCLSTWGLGQRGPSGEIVLSVDGVRVPRAPITTNALRTDEAGKPIARSLNYNEFIVYNTSQVRIRYLLLVRNAKTCLLCCKHATVRPLNTHRERYEKISKKNEVPETVLCGNDYERAICRGLLFDKGLSVEKLWGKELEGWVDERRYAKRWDPATQPTLHSQVCTGCADTILSDMLYEFCREHKSSIPDSIRKRPNCWYGSACKSQTNRGHVVEMNHLCERTRGEDEKNVFWMRGGNVVLTGQSTYSNESIKLSSSGSAYASNKLNLHVPLAIEFGIRGGVTPSTGFTFVFQPHGPEEQPDANAKGTVQVQFQVSEDGVRAQIKTSESESELATIPVVDTTKPLFVLLKWTANKRLHLSTTQTAREDGRSGMDFRSVVDFGVDLGAACGRERVWCGVIGEVEIFGWGIWETGSSRVSAASSQEAEDDGYEEEEEEYTDEDDE